MQSTLGMINNRFHCSKKVNGKLEDKKQKLFKIKQRDEAGGNH